MKKKFLPLFILLTMIMSMVTVKADNAEYSLINGEYVRLLGRGEIIEGSRTFNWPNAGFEFKFSGNTAQVHADVSNFDSEKYHGNYFTMAVYNGDKLVRTERMKLIEGWNTIYTYSEGDPAEKTIMLVRSSEACRGTLRMSRIRTDSIPSATQPRQRHIEFIGDSYTAGYGNSKNLSSATEYCAQNTDNWNSYTGMVARHFGADNTVIAHQGKGVYANGELNNTTDNMSDQFNYAEIVPSVPRLSMSTKAPHDFSSYQPNLVSVWLGTNDKRAALDIETLKIKYEELLDNIRSKYPEAVILCVAIEDSLYHDTIKQIADSRGAANRYYMLTLNDFISTTFGHPDIAEDERIANQFISKINSIPGIWEITGTNTNTELLSLTVNYNTNVITITGKTPTAFEQVSAMVLKPGIKIPQVTKDTLLYYNQTQTDKDCKYSFEFEVDKLPGKYTYYMNTGISDSFAHREFNFKQYIPSLYAEKNGVKITKMSELSQGDTITAVVSGFDLEEGIEGMLAIAQYKDGVLNTVSVTSASEDTIDYGTEIEFETQILEGTDRVRLYYMNKANIAPLIGAYTIE